MDEKINQKWNEQFEHQYKEMMLKNFSEENDYINIHLEKLKPKIQGKINKQFDFQTKETLGIPTSRKLTVEEVQKIIAHKQSSSGIEQLKKITEMVSDEFKNALKKEYHVNKGFFNLDKKTYIEKCFEENLKKISDEKKNRQKDIFSENTGLELLVEYNANCTYPRARENLAAAKLFLDCGLTEGAFDLYLSLKPQDSNLIPPLVNKDEIPVLIEGKEIGYPGFYLTKLSPENPKCAVLGKLTSCCQHLDGDGKDCALHAISSEQGGLYVLCSYKRNMASHEDTIIAQCWAWRSKSGALVFDSIESVVHLREKYEIMISDFFTYWGHTLVTRYNMPRVLVGTGGETPNLLGTLEPFNAEFPIDYNQYRDSLTQRIIADSALPFVQLYINSTKNKGSQLCLKSKTEDSLTNSKLKKEEVERNRQLFYEWCAFCMYSERDNLDFSLIYDYLSRFQLTKIEADAFFENTKKFFKLLENPGDFSEIVRLSKLGVYPFIKNSGKTALTQVSQHASAKIVSELLETRAKETINIRQNGCTALQLAITKGDVNSAILLIKHHADLSVLMPQDKKTILMLAAGTKNVECFSLVLKASPKALLHHQDIEKRTVLMHAAMGGNSEMVALLLKEGFESMINHKDLMGNTALMYAAKIGNFGMVEMLLKANAEVNITNWEWNTALMYACKRSCESDTAGIVELLLKSCTKDTINQTDNIEKTALMWGAGNDKIVELLLKHGAWFNNGDKVGCTALIYAAAKGNAKSIKWILDTGAADKFHRDWFGRTALMIAAKNGHRDAFLTLLELTDKNLEDEHMYSKTILRQASCNNNHPIPDTAEPFYCKLKITGA